MVNCNIKLVFAKGLILNDLSIRCMLSLRLFYLNMFSEQNPSPHFSSLPYTYIAVNEI